MSHAIEEKSFNFWKTFRIAFVVAVVILILIGAVNFASNSGSGTSAAATQVLNVGPIDEVEVKIPLLYLIAFVPDKNIIIRRPTDNEFFLKTPAGELHRYNKKTGKYDEGVSTFGYNVSRVYIRSAEGMARVEVSFARGEFKPAAPPAQPPLPTPLIPVATPPSRGVTA
ncbi:MAG: hypothetical protein Q8Q17_01800 [bacterium]|nr:hypothetical protein [bacterium]